MINSPPTTDESPLIQIVTLSAAAAAGAGGLIHLKVLGDHLDLALVAGGFALMGLLQWTFVWCILSRPSHGVLLLGGLLHAGIAMLWMVSRTVGLAFINGAQDPEAVGVADLAANTFSVAVVGAAFVGLGLYRSGQPVVIPPSIATRVRGLVLAGAIFLTVPALLAPHSHAVSDSHVTEVGYDHARPPSPENSEHDHAGA
ncbi:MAG: hypothetical protein ACRDVK_08260 [Acidimicrobiia bacterium]